MSQLNRVDPKHPAASQIYTMNWTPFLNAGATISVSSWDVPTPLVKVADAIVTGNVKTSVQVSGGAEGSEYLLRNTITTSDGETLVMDGALRVQTEGALT